MTVQTVLKSSQISVDIRVLLFTVLLTLGFATVSSAACVDYELSVNPAVQAYDLDTLEKLLVTLNRQADCPVSYLDGVKRSMAQIAAAKADVLTQQHKFAEAEKWLKRAPTTVWSTQVIYGDIAARRQQWQKAAQFFHRALEFINDPQRTPKAPTSANIERVYQLAQEAQLLAGDLGDTIDDSGNARGVMRGSVRGYGAKRRLIPILFEFGGSKLSRKGKKSVQRLANYIIRKKQRVTKVTLIGHSDSKGKHQVCDRVSKKRAQTVGNYLRKIGVNTKISTFGKGKRQPLKLVNEWKLTAIERDKLNRRVEFKIDYK